MVPLLGTTFCATFVDFITFFEGAWHKPGHKRCHANSNPARGCEGTKKACHVRWALVAADLADIGVAKCHVGILGYQSGFLHGLDEIPCDVWSIVPLSVIANQPFVAR